MQCGIRIDNKTKKAYEYIMMILALVVVCILATEHIFHLSDTVRQVLYLIDTTILGVFIADYVVRLLVSRDKIDFIKGNVLDLIAIIPFSSIFRAFRLVRLVRLARLSKFNRLIRAGLWIRRFKEKLIGFVKTNGLIYMILVTMCMILIGALGIYLLGEMTFLDGIWWAFVTATTVGYGDISPVSLGGRILAGILMLVGIGFIGMLTGTIATYFLGGEKNKKQSYEQEVIVDIKNKLNNFDDLSIQDIECICRVLMLLKTESKIKI